MSGTQAGLAIAVFLACAVEAVEATTIVLAAGTARDWRSATAGMISALAVLVVVVAALGSAVSALPLKELRLVVGALLLVFGLQWLRKAILRASGHKALHDEDEIYRTQLGAAAAAPGRRLGSVPDWYGFTLSFKGVLLEGLEVVFIALTFGKVYYLGANGLPWFFVCLFFLGVGGANFSVYTLWLPEQYPTECRASAFAFSTSFARVAGAGITFLVGAGVRHFGSIGTPVALTAIAFAIGLLLTPFGAETRGRPLPS
jgi:uncharacterized membrane protein